jgi:hypothetical protein
MPCQELDCLHTPQCCSVEVNDCDCSVHVCGFQEIHSSEFMSGVTLRIWRDLLVRQVILPSQMRELCLTGGRVAEILGI